MGLLDDAIREHLELKRRRGADPDEVARQENEALGDPRRAEFARPETGESAAGAEVGTAGDAEAPEPVAEPAAPVEPEAPVEAGDEREPFDIEAAEPPTTIAEPPPDTDPWLDERDEVPADEALDHPRGGETAAEDAETAAGAAEIAPPSGETAARGGATAAGDAETAAGDAETAPETGEAAADEGEEDVLEETPDFLQETPEHDRLWFEQRPPRDFDWDK